MKRALVIIYSQTGQLKKIVDSVTVRLREDFELVFEELKPVPSYPFPWQGRQFFHVFPESVQEIPCVLEPFEFNPDQDFDLVILAYQVWFSISLPPVYRLSAVPSGRESPERQAGHHHPGGPEHVDHGPGNSQKTDPGFRGQTGREYCIGGPSSEPGECGDDCALVDERPAGRRRSYRPTFPPSRGT